jgi:ABC-type multidrug transport system fused ATPase/permease subunit
MACGVLLHGGLITAIFSQALSLSPRARVQMTNSRLINHISTDVLRIDFCMGYFHMSWTAPIQLTICLILLLINLGPSALASFALLIVATPINTMVMKHLFSIRIKSMSWTDKRSKLLQEMLSGMRVIKFLSWEIPFLKRIAEYCKLETMYATLHPFIILTYPISQLHTNATNPSGGLDCVRRLSPITSRCACIHHLLADWSFTVCCEYLFFSYLVPANQAAPHAPSCVTPVVPLNQTYGYYYVAVSLSSIADAVTACKRLNNVFEAETSDGTLVLNSNLDVAVRIDGVDFTWDSPPPKPEDPKIISNWRRMHNGMKGKSTSTRLPMPQPVDEANIFKLRSVNIEIPRGKLVAIVGAVGAGKMSLLQGIIGEMRWVAGTVKFGGSVAYCAQTAWIQVQFIQVAVVEN